MRQVKEMAQKVFLNLRVKVKKSGCILPGTGKEGIRTKVKALDFTDLGGSFFRSNF